jgi:hypothetical protein
MSSTTESDTGLGLAMVFGALALGAAAYMPVAGSQVTTAYAFAAAVALSVVGVAAIHLYWG